MIPADRTPVSLKLVGHSNNKQTLVSLGTLSRLRLHEGGKALVYVGLKSFPVSVAQGELGEREIILPRTLEHVRIGRLVNLVSQEVAFEPAAQGIDDRKSRGSTDVLSSIVLQPPEVRFDDIAGMEEAKANIRAAIVDPFEFPEEYAFYKRKSGGGILLYGPPGCGKTYIAAAAANDADATFISVKGSDLKDMYVGESERNVSRIFNLAREGGKTIIFLDEIDTILPSRTTATAEHEKSLVGEFLAQMDGLEEKGLDRKYLVLVATNRPWSLDLPLRDRFDSLVFIPHPDEDARQQQVELHLRGRPIDESVDLMAIAQKTKGLSSRQIEKLCNKACDIPLRRRIESLRKGGREGAGKRPPVTMPDFDEAITHVRNVLPSWYREALRELERMSDEEREAFEDLELVGQEYLKDWASTKI